MAFAAAHLGESPENTTAKADQIHLLPYAQRYVEALNLEWRPNSETKAILVERHRALQRLFDENYGHIKIPIIGIGFNANDTGLFGGFGLFVVMFVLYFALKRERANVVNTFAKAVFEKCLPDVYRVMSMSQVLTVPPGFVAGHRTQRWLNRSHKVLFVLPGAVQVFVVYIDFGTIRYGTAISRFNTLFALTGESVCLVGIVLCTISCFYESYKTDAIWQGVAHAIETKKQAFPIPGLPPASGLKSDSGPGMSGDWI